ncbi:peptide chain release factor N(5)-glutamine methyltransferase [Canibacter zhoujuaniae]|uniref:peptide chain release factor N(5)-glutamine methyltransferase n=1 Tax=Canibacter zhoujuaniae TaxID=2708343 RepID=UPI001424186A|nr:peptide chain release factor N(5)-glutamine methyltransferase [Canibacter zhoujuaniae]
MIEISVALRETAKTLANAGVDSFQAEAELLLAELLNTSRGGAQVAALTGKTLDEDQAEQLGIWVARRAAREPLQHILGSAPFMDFEVAVGPGVFIPRPETEQVIAAAVHFKQMSAGSQPVRRALDLCAGSGVIALALARTYPQAEVLAVEKETAALHWAKQNIDSLGGNRVHLMQADICELTSAELGEPFDIIVSNPPYVPADCIPQQAETAKHDPASALYSGSDGLTLIRKLIPLAVTAAAPGCVIAIEHTEEQGAAVCALLTAAGWLDAHTVNDLSGRPRASLGRLEL